MAQLINQDSRNWQPINRVVGRHTSGIRHDPPVFATNAAGMGFYPDDAARDFYTGHPKSPLVHMQELGRDPNMPGLHRVTAEFGPVDDYRFKGDLQEVHSTATADFSPLPNPVGVSGDGTPVTLRSVHALSELRAAANAFVDTANVRKPLFSHA